MKKTLLLLIIFCVGVSNAETIFFKKDGSPITSQEHKILYQIMLENQFPMSLVYGSYKIDEVKAMNDAIKTKVPNTGIEARFLPTILYELFILNFIRENFENIEEATSGTLEIYLPESRRKLGPKIDNDFRPEDVKEVNLNPAVIQFHENINNYILEVLEKNDLAIPNNTTDAIKIIDSIDDFWKPLKVGSNGFAQVRGEKNDMNNLEPAVMRKAIEIEYRAFEANKFPLYRGANVLDDQKDVSSYTATIDPSTMFNRSISFGNTLLGGIVFDSGACAYFYMSEEYGRPVGYALLIDKNDYANGRLRNMFYIPEISGLLDLIAQGEMFHARSKVPDLMSVNSMSMQAGQRGITNIEPYIPYYQIVAPDREKAQEIYSSILKYIRDNHVIIKQR